MNRWTQAAIIVLLAVIAATLVSSSHRPTTTRVVVEQATPYVWPPEPVYRFDGSRRADGCPSTWVYANACSFVWINPERTDQP